MKCKHVYMRKHHFIQWLFFVLVLFSPSLLFAQTNAIKGVVTDKIYGEPLIGVSVNLKGTSTTVATDLDGRYSIQVPTGGVLVFSYIGMETQEILINEKQQGIIDVVLQEDAQGLEEVVVIGYGVQRKADVTTAVSTVNSKEWAERPIISAQQGLQGKAAGVQVVQPSGKPGEGMQIRVRGSSSLKAGNDPIYVVDGIITNDITNISPSDIENMTILKDASSAAIYGSRAANGVVLITTKRGTTGKAKVEFFTYIGLSNVSRQIETLNTKQYYTLMDEVGVSYDPTDRNYTNWANETFRTAFQQNYQLSVSGGSEKTTYFISGGYQKEEGVVSPAEYDRFSFRTNINSEVASWLKINTNMSFARNSRLNATDNAHGEKGGTILSILTTPPNLTIWDKNNPGQYMPNPHQASAEHPIGQADTYDFNREYRFMGNLGLDFRILEGLHFKPSISVDYTSHTWDKFIDPIKTGYGRQANGRGEHADDDYLTWSSENMLTYSKRFNDKHNFTFLGGATVQRYRHNNAYMSAEDYVKGTTFDRMTINMANKINTAKTDKDGWSLASFIARVQYDFESKYLLTANFRADGSSKLYHKWDYFPSVSAGWRFSSEKFFEPLKLTVDDAKLRFGWGRTGNQGGIGNYDMYDKWNIQRREEVGNGPALTEGKLGNRELKWEITTQYNVGMDFSLFNSRLTGELDYYYKKTTDLLLEIKLPESVGKTLPMRNDGEMLNKGFEFNLNGQILTGAFKWDAGLNMSFNKNELTKLSLTKQYTAANIDDRGDVIIVREGLPLGSFYGYVAEGVDPETGDMIYKDLNEDGVISGSDRKVLGDAQPDFVFGFTNNFSWKRFTLSAFFQGSYGNDIYNATRMYTEGMYNYMNQSAEVLKRWQRPGMITDIPRAGNTDNSRISTRFIEDGSYLRLKALTLSYNFDRKFLEKLHISNLTVYGTAHNLFTLTKYRGYDPELSWADSGQAAQLGIDMGTYPQSRSFIFGLNVTF